MSLLILLRRNLSAFLFPMPVNLCQYRAAVGEFNNRFGAAKLPCFGFSNKRFDTIHFFNALGNFFLHVSFFSLLTILSGDVESNPGPSRNQSSLNICHWNLNSISAHNFRKVSLLSAYITVNKPDIICLSETYLDSSILSDDENLEIPGYSFVRVDHPANTKRGGVCLYYRECLPLKVNDINYLQECICVEVDICGKL